MAKKDPVIVGIGESEQVGIVPGKTSLDHAVEASIDAIRDAGISPREIDGVFTCQGVSDYRSLPAGLLAEYLGLGPAYTNWMPYGAVATAAVLGAAAAAIKAGYCSTALVASADTLRSGLGRGGAIHKIAENAHADFEALYGPIIIAQYAMYGQRHMHEFGTRSEDFAEIAVAERLHAAMTPKAQEREPITIDDVLSSRMIATPLHKLDCALISDGGAALIMTSSDRAPSNVPRPVQVLGYSDVGESMHISEAPTLTETATRLAAERAFAMAGIQPAEVDIVYPYDNFTCMALITLEDLGFCKKGEGGDFVRDGRLRPGGALPMNTHGGLLSFAHHGRSIFAATEAVRQLRGQAGERQVPGAKIAVWQGFSGVASSASVNVLAV